MRPNLKKPKRQQNGVPLRYYGVLVTGYFYEYRLFRRVVTPFCFRLFFVGNLNEQQKRYSYDDCCTAVVAVCSQGKGAGKFLSCTNFAIRSYSIRVYELVALTSELDRIVALWIF